MTSSGGTGSGEWQVAQLGDWFGNAGKTGPDGGSAVAVLKNSKHPKEAMEFLDWFNTQVPDLVSQGLVPAATAEDAETPSEWSTFFGGQDIMKEFKTANNNMGDFTYMPGHRWLRQGCRHLLRRTDHLCGYAEELRPVCFRVTLTVRVPSSR